MSFKLLELFIVLLRGISFTCLRQNLTYRLVTILSQVIDKNDALREDLSLCEVFPD